MDPLVAVVASYRAKQATVAKRTTVLLASQWARVDPVNPAASWARQIPAAVNITRQGMRASATGSTRYVSLALRAQRATPAPAGTVDASAFAENAADGRSLGSLLYMPVITARTAIDSGMSPAKALQQAQTLLLMRVATEVADAGRQGVSAGMVADYTCTGYYRQPGGSACARCAILAGKRFGTFQGAAFDRHPRCLPAGTTVSVPSVLATTRRWYEGELVVFTTASGEKLSITGNHPVLTDQGWVPANLVREGDNVLRSTAAQVAPLMVPDEGHRPTLVEDLWRAHSVVPLVQVPTTAEDFHGDGMDGYVDVVLADRLLRDRSLSEISEPLDHLGLTSRTGLLALLDAYGSPQQVLMGLLSPSDSIMRSHGISSTALRREFAHADHLRFTASTDVQPTFLQATSNRWASNAVLDGESQLALASEIRSRDVFGGEIEPVTRRWDPTGTYGSPDDALGYASLGRDLGSRLAGQVELDRVVELHRVSWSGHVFNLDSGEGWFAANNLIVSNCQCTAVAASEHYRSNTTAPSAQSYFDSLNPSRQQATFGKANAQAIREGADPAAVINARRGMSAPGFNWTTDTWGNTYSSRLIGPDGSIIARPPPGSAARLPMPDRLTPAAIYKLAASREEAVAMLRQYAYII